MSNIIRARQPDEPNILPNGEPVIVSEGKIGALVQYPVLVDMGKGYVEKMFEKFVRPPGTRILAVQENKIYLQKEARLENDGAFDWRLPGGKVFDRFPEYKAYMFTEVPEEQVVAAAQKELAEEADLAGQDWRMLDKKTCGSTVQWDLYYLEATKLSEVSHEHNEGEQIEDGAWKSFAEVEQMCKSGEIGEGRTVSVLLQYINNT